MILAIAMVISMLPTAVFAVEDPQPTGTDVQNSTEVLAEEPVKTENNIATTSTNEDTIAYPVEGGNIYFRGNTSGNPGVVTGVLDCDNTVTKATIPSEINGMPVTFINSKAFESCSALIDITIPDSITLIGSEAFKDCSSLPTIVIPDSITYINTAAFYGCSALHSIVIPESITTIYNSTFQNCRELANVSLPQSLTSIKSSAFSDCVSLDHITIPENVSEIGTFAFSGCTSLKKVVLPDNITNIERQTFRDCTALEELELPENLKSIDTWAFFNCVNLEVIKFPQSISSISANAFEGCTGIKRYEVEPYNSFYSSEDGILYNVDKKELVLYPIGTENLYYELPETVQSIGDHAFAYSLLLQITIPNTVTSIGSYAFYNCDQLSEVKLPDGITEIGDSTFWMCRALKQITIPDGVTVIGRNAFYNSGLEYIVLPATLESIGYDSFLLCNNLKDIYYAEDETEWKKVSFENYSSAVKNAIIHYNSTGPEDENPSGSETASVRYFREWDAENQVAYWGDIILIGSNQSIVVNGKTDISFLDNLDQLVGNYVLVEEMRSSEDNTEPSTLISIVPIETKLGTITEVGDVLTPYIKINGEIYNIPSFLNSSYVNASVIYWTLNNKLERFQTLSRKTARFLSWNDESRILMIDRGLGSNRESYRLSPLASESTIEALKSIPYLENIAIAYDANNLIYFVSVISDDPYYEVPEESLKNQELLLEYQNKWFEKYEALIAAMREALDEYAKSEDASKESIISAQAKAMQQQDEGTNDRNISFPSEFKDSWKEYAYKALATLLYENAVSNINFGDIDVSDIFAGGTLVNSLMRSLSNNTETYEYGDVVVNIHVNQFGSSRFGQVTCFSKQNPSKTYSATVVSTQTECAQAVQAYWEELKDLENSALFNIYLAISKDILGKSIYSYTEDFLKKEVSRYSAQLMKTGVGDIAKTLNTCYNYATYVNKFISMDPNQLETQLPLIFSIKFEDTSITDKTVSKAMKAVKKAGDQLNQAFADYATGTLQESKVEKFWRTVFGCPVSISIYDSSGEQVGYVGEDDIWYSDCISIEERGEAKIIDVLVDEQMSFVVNAIDYGTLSCSIEEYDLNIPTGRVNFYDIPLTPSQKFSFSLPKALLSAEEVIEIKTGEQIIIADEYIPISEAAGVEINCKVTGALSPENTIAGEGTYVQGDAVVLLAVPADGYRFAGWYLDEDLVCTSTVYEFVAKEDADIVAHFVLDEDTEMPIQTFILTVSATTGGTVSGGGKFKLGEIVTVVATPDRGYIFDGWYSNDLLLSRSSEYQLEANKDINLLAKFIEKDTSSIGGGGSSSGNSSISYSITVKNCTTGGSVKADEHRAQQGDTVTLTLSVDDGYELKSLTVLDRNNKKIEVEKVNKTEYTFEMPRSSVTVEAVFALTTEETGPLPFTDVAKENWSYHAVCYAYENNLMSGTSNTTFEPDLTTTRAMIVTILYRLDGTPIVSGVSDFTDVESGQWYSNAIDWATANAIVSGYGNGLFGLDDYITREQLAAILYRYAQYKDYDTSASSDLSRYTDLDQLSMWAQEAIAWANAEGIVNGTSATTLSPQDNATRAQAAAMLMQFCENVLI